MPFPAITRAGLVASLLSSATGQAVALGDDCEFTAERRADLGTSGAERIEIFARAGTLEVRPVKATSVSARGRACASSAAFLADTNVHARREGRIVRVYVQLPDEMSGIGNFYATLDLRVDVPTDMAVQVTDTSGDMTIDGARVERVTDSSGNIVARRLPAGIEIGDSSGDIRVEDAGGLVTITDSSGDIRIDGAGSVRIPTDSSGSIIIERVTGNVLIENDSSGDVAVTKVDGDVELIADSSGAVDVSEVKGRVLLPRKD